MTIFFRKESKFDYAIGNIAAVNLESDTNEFIVCDNLYNMQIISESSMEFMAASNEYLRLYLNSEISVNYALNYISCYVTLSDNLIMLRGEQLDGAVSHMKVNLADYDLKVVAMRGGKK